MNSQKRSGNSDSQLKKAVDKTPDIKGFFKPGLQAVKDSNKYIEYKRKLGSRDTMGSVDIDGATKTLYPDANRWDYVIEHARLLYYVEPHSANASHEIDKVCKKSIWLKWWLKEKAPELRKIRTAGLFWVQTGKNSTVLNGSRQKMLLANYGVEIGCPLILV